MIIFIYLCIQAPYIIYVEVISTENLATSQVPKKIVKNLRQVSFFIQSPKILRNDKH